MSQLDWLVAGMHGGYGFRGPPFPQKLFSVVDVPPRAAVIRWTDDGRAIVVDAGDYEQRVMRQHPGLVEIASFANFRRQMREYGFDWSYDSETREFEFAHPSFRRDRPDLLPDVLTRRKRRRRHAAASSAVATRPQRAAVTARRYRSRLCKARIPRHRLARHARHPREDATRTSGESGDFPVQLATCVPLSLIHI